MRAWLVLLLLLSSIPSCGSDRSPVCDRLAEKCPYCTLPGLRATCEAAVDSDDPASCQDGLDDPDVRSNCVAPGPGPDGNPGQPDAAPAGDDTVCGNPNECICPAAGTCDYDCLSGSTCELQCMPGSSCTATCTGTFPCNVDCAASAQCNVDCQSGDCDVTCPATGCIVTNCPVATCDVTCGLVGLPTRSGTTATCP